MRFVETPLKGAFVVEAELQVDNRGFFARTFCMDEFASHGLDFTVAQTSLSFNETSGTIRGMHFQSAPFAETKLVRCVTGSIYDVIVDVRPDSKTFLRWFAIELSATNYKSLFIPEGFAHGFQTLQHKSEVHYQITPAYHPDKSIGFVWNDARVGINWPMEVSAMSERDLNFPPAAQVIC